MNRWVIFDRDPGWGTNSSDSWTTVVTPIFLSLETWSIISDTRGEITITQGRQVGLAPESCSRIVEAHGGSVWKMADFPNLVGTVTKQSRPSNTHQTASLCSCLTNKGPSCPKASSMALSISSILAFVFHFRWSTMSNSVERRTASKRSIDQCDHMRAR